MFREHINFPFSHQQTAQVPEVSPETDIHCWYLSALQIRVTKHNIGIVVYALRRISGLGNDKETPSSRTSSRLFLKV